VCTCNPYSSSEIVLPLMELYTTLFWIHIPLSVFCMNSFSYVYTPAVLCTYISLLDEHSSLPEKVYTTLKKGIYYFEEKVYNSLVAISIYILFWR
jgi:hypothetical protein